MDFRDGQFYEIKHPVHGRTEVWKGERINAYEVNYKTDIQLAVKRGLKKTTKSKTKTK